MIKIKYGMLRSVGLGLLMLPLLIFLLTFVRLSVGIPAIVLAVLAYLLAIRGRQTDERVIEISVVRLILLVFAALAWCFLGGQGGLFYQTSDWNERNAIFRDLITRSWPVYYERTNTALTYYIGHWLPAALIGKLAYVLSDSLHWGWHIGNMALLIWTSACVVTVLLLLLQAVAPSGAAKQWIAIAVMIFFSGFDWIGCLLKGWTWNDFKRILHLEWWIEGMQISSNTTCLFWVFNQAVPAWIATLLFLNERDASCYAMIFVFAFLSAPLPCVGLAVLMLGAYICTLYQAARRKEMGICLKKAFSWSNIISVIVFLIPALYFLSNLALKSTKSAGDEIFVPTFGWKCWVLAAVAAGMAGAGIYLTKRRRGKNGNGALFGLIVLVVTLMGLVYLHPEITKEYYLFLLLEVGVYFGLLLPFEANNPLYYIAALIFLAAPTIKIGIGADFCMRATIPPVIVLMAMCLQTLSGEKELLILQAKNKKRRTVEKLLRGVLAACLIIGMGTPVMEFGRGVYKVIEERTLELTADDIGTLNCYHSSGGIYGNFVSEDYRDSAFFKYIARK